MKRLYNVFCEFGTKALREESTQVSEALVQKKECVANFNKIVEILHKKGHLLAKEGNYTKQVDAFIDSITKENFELLSEFD